MFFVVYIYFDNKMRMWNTDGPGRNNVKIWQNL